MSETTAKPVVFIHGLWLHATSWAPWIELFERGRLRVVGARLARGSPTPSRRPGRTRTASPTTASTTSSTHYSAIIETLPEPPILVGHSFGGMIAEKLLGLDKARRRGRHRRRPDQGRAAAAAVVAARHPAGLQEPGEQAPRRLADRRAVPLQLRQRRRRGGVRRSCTSAWAIPAPGKPLFEAAAANFSLHSPAEVDTDNEDRGPLLLVMGGQDHTVPEAITKATLKQYRHSDAVTDLIEFEDRGHSLTIDNGWREVAEASLTWLDEQGLGALLTRGSAVDPSPTCRRVGRWRVDRRDA